MDLEKAGGGATLLTSIAFTFIAYLLLLVLKSYASNDINIESTGVNPYIILFVLGMLAADISFSNKVAYLRLNKFPWLLITLISFILAFVFKVYTKIGIAHDSIFLLNLMDIIFGLFSFCLLLTCSHATSKHPIAYWLSNGLSWRPLVFIGSFSYSLYLVHAPLIQVITQYIIGPLHIGAYTAICVTATIGLAVLLAVAYLFFIICERPFLNILKNRKMSVAVYEATESPAP